MNTFPHRCSCGRLHSFTQWLALPSIGEMVDEDDAALSLRNCPCRSTMAVPTAIEAAYSLVCAADDDGLHEAACAALLRLALLYQRTARESQSDADHALAHELFDLHGGFDRFGFAAGCTRDRLDEIAEIEPRDWVRQRVDVAREIVGLFEALVAEDDDVPELAQCAVGA